MHWIEIIIWAAIGIWDLCLKFRGHDTISKQVENFMPRWADVAIVIGLLVFVWWMFGPAGFVAALRWTMIGHILLGHETYQNKKNL